jgi:predicted nucleotidyltransferase
MNLSRPLSTVTPTLDGDILATLARHEATVTTGQLHRVLTRASEDGIRKALQRLVKQGIVLSDRVGNAYTYRLNHDHLAAAHVVGLADMMATFLERLRCELEGWSVPPTYAAVFGSAARGTMTVDSDIDLLLIRPDTADVEQWDTQVNELVDLVTSWTGNDTRPLQFTTSDLPRVRKEQVLHDVLTEGLTVAGTREWLKGQLQKIKKPL